jgi:hypothetical protein
MAVWQGSGHITGTSNGTAYIEIQTQVYQTGDTGWDVHFQVYYRVRNGWNVARNARGGGNYGWSNGGPWNGPGAYPADYNIFNGSFHIGLDANGYASYGLNAYIDLDFNTPATISTGGSEGMPRIAKAPSINSLTHDSVKTTTARLGAEISGYGHGTAAAFEMYYRQQGVGGYISLGQQGDVGGYNYWNVSGLQPGKTYEYYVRCWNNNGDTAQTGVQSFRTTPQSGMIAVIRGLVQ